MTGRGVGERVLINEGSDILELGMKQCGLNEQKLPFRPGICIPMSN